MPRRSLLWWSYSGKEQKVKNNREQENSRQAEPKKKKPRKRHIDPKTGLTVFEPNTVYFSDFLLNHVGAKWPEIKSSLYDAGYQVTEVNGYRDGLLEDFKVLCQKHHFRGIV